MILALVRNTKQWYKMWICLCFPALIEAVRPADLLYQGFPENVFSLFENLQCTFTYMCILQNIALYLSKCCIFTVTLL